MWSARDESSNWTPPTPKGGADLCITWIILKSCPLKPIWKEAKMTQPTGRKSLQEFTRDEFLDFVTRIFEGDFASEDEDDRMVAQFDRLVEPNPRRNGLIFWPEDGVEDSPEGVVREVEKYCREHGLPCFKDSVP